MSQIVSDLRIQKILSHFEFLQAKLNENLKNEELIKFSKEYAELKPIYEKIQEFKKIKNELSEAKELFNDPEFKDLAGDEVSKLEERLIIQDKELQLLLLPKDVNDNRSVILELRAGTGGDFLRSCLWLLKNPNHKLHIEENRLILNDIWLFFIKPNGQVIPNQDISILMDLMRWKNLNHNRRNGLKMHYQWQSNIESEYKLQKKDRFDSGFHPWPMSAILNSNIDIQITHDPFQVKYDESSYLICGSQSTFRYTSFFF